MPIAITLIPKVSSTISRSGPQIPILINILCFTDHQIILSGLRIGKVWEPLPYTVTFYLIGPYV